MQINATVKKWGNSYGIPVSKKVLEQMQLKENAKVNITLEKAPDIMDVFGIAKTTTPTEKILKEFDRSDKDEILLR